MVLLTVNNISLVHHWQTFRTTWWRLFRLPRYSFRARHKTSMEVDEVMGMLGGYGMYQMITYFAIAFVDMRGAWHVMSLVFMGAKLPHHCTISGALNDTIPQILADDGSLQWSQCQMFVNASLSNDTASCQNGWTYDNPDNQSIIQTQVIFETQICIKCWLWATGLLHHG